MQRDFFDLLQPDRATVNAQAFTRLIVSTRGGRTLSREMTIMTELAASLGIEVHLASDSMMERGRVAIDADCLVAGRLTFVLHALRHLGVPQPEHTPYPPVLTPWLRRKVWRVPQLRDVQESLRSGARVFVKPADGWKRFTGFVTSYPDDDRFNGYSRNRPVWVSEPIRFVSEWRAYVLKGSIRGLSFADHGGDRNVAPDETEIFRAVQALEDSGSAPAGYCIDFGVTAEGETSLVELNDGFGFGAYEGLDPLAYWEITAARWQELTTAAFR